MLSIKFPVEKTTYVPKPFDIVRFCSPTSDAPYVGMVIHDGKRITVLGTQDGSPASAGAMYTVEYVTILIHYPNAVVELGGGIKI